ncbi:MAG: alkaline phosphatase family protein [Planctomycetota bacterium]|jgi:predicted AlkP superfamily pyrophosphatase or phosphodiesterase
MRRTAVLNVVGLSPSLIGERTPNLRAFAESGCLRALSPVLPAVTCSVQSSMLTGVGPEGHGIVGNGWYDRSLAEVQFWKQSNHLVQAPKIWDAARERDASFTCANLFWWYNMYSSVDVAVTPRPMYPADGRKIPDVHTYPADLRDRLQAKLGQFPLFRFWGPAASIESTRWIASAAREVELEFSPTLSLVYLPHLDYGLQKLGPNDPGIDGELRAVDAIFGDLVAMYRERGVRVVALSEYGITPVDTPVFPNRLLRDAGLVEVRHEMGRELLDPGASHAFAVADHQVAHVYVANPSRIEEVADLLRVEGIEAVTTRRGEVGLGHGRAGDLVLVAEPGAWFAHDYWLDDHRAPDFARTVDIHRKPGYDPRELFVDPAIAFPRAKIAWTLLKKKLGFRSLMEVIPLDASLVKGSHGRIETDPSLMPVLMTQDGASGGALPCTAVHDVVLNEVFGG